MNDRLTDLLLAIVSYVTEHDGYMTKTKLLKLVYLFDVEFYRIHGNTYSGFQWKYYHLGPWTREFDPLLEQLVSQGALTENIVQRADFDTRFLRSSGPADLRKPFSNSKDEATLKILLNTWGSSATGEILDYVYFRTEPMEHGIRNENLDFSRILQQVPGTYKRPASTKTAGEIKKLRRRKDQKTGEVGPALDTVNRLDKFFDGYRVSAINTDLMVEFTKKLQGEGLVDSTINRSLSALRRMFHLVKKKGDIHDIPYFPMLPESRPRKGVLAQGKYEALFDASPEHVRTALAVGYHTGMRAGEVRGLRWEQVNFLDRIIRLNAGETKNGEGREIPFGPELTAVLEEQHRRASSAGSPWVCFRVTRKGKLAKLGDFRKVWQDRCVKLGLGRMEGEKYIGLIFHDLRRTFVTDAENAGAPRHEVMKITGHKTEAIYKRYAIDNPARRRVALEEILAYRAARNGANSGQIVQSNSAITAVDATIQ